MNMQLSQVKVKAQEFSESWKEKLSVLRFRDKTLSSEIKVLNTEQLELTNDMELMKMSSSIFQELVDIVSTKNIKRIETLVNTALATIFFDQVIEFRIKQDVKRNINVYKILLIKEGVEGSKDSYGGGPIAVVAFILKILCNILAGGYPLIVLDESLAFLSEKYIPNTSKFIKELSESFDLPVVLVTHQPLFSEFSDFTYQVKKSGTKAVFELVE